MSARLDFAVAFESNKASSDTTADVRLVNEVTCTLLLQSGNGKNNDVWW
jgi:hypothetical protein